MKIIYLIENIGKSFLSFIKIIGQVGIFIILSLRYFVHPKIYFKNILKYFFFILISSIPIVALTTFFSGMVLALQSYTGFSRFSAESAIPKIVLITLTRELGPVLTALMIAGRVGASIAAEIATMRVTEQIDALKTLNTNFYNYLVTPRIFSLTIALPILVSLGDAIGVYGGYLISIYKLDFNSSIYISNTLDFFSFEDYFSGIIKGTCFGFIISLFSCYFGLYSSKGALGVGSATTNTVVTSSIFILIFNYLLTELFF